MKDRDWLSRQDVVEFMDVFVNTVYTWTHKKTVILVIREDVTMKFFGEVGCILSASNLFLERVEVWFYR